MQPPELATHWSRTTLPAVLISRPVIYIWQVNDLQQTLTWSKSTPPHYIHLTPISCTPGHKPWWHGRTDTWMSVVTTWWLDGHHLLPKYHVYADVRVTFLVSECVTLSFETFVYSNFHIWGIVINADTVRGMFADVSSCCKRASVTQRSYLSCE
jgi:hypothetical protein